MNIVEGNYVVTDYDEYVSVDKIGVLSVINSRLYADVSGRKVVLTEVMSTVDLAAAVQEILDAQAARK